ncbi:hypothetical protein E2562_030094 [Oryza meyeriana var. granulata]|uniref:Uncharacterized protein n=1 Tax=Oryza meyeriana var. granulata TaxID=110450 RepID=A0A6G1CV61_9ORYZ|nr:hypothetical protein E2562_030094 [Oryza meyeriana var. granulata]
MGRTAAVNAAGRMARLHAGGGDLRGGRMCRHRTKVQLVEVDAIDESTVALPSFRRRRSPGGSHDPRVAALDP